MLFGKIFPFFAMNVLLNKIIEPENQIREEQKVFSNQALKIMLVPLFMEQLLSVLVGVADTFMVSYAGEAAVSGVSLVNMFNTVFLFLFSALAAGGSVVVSQYIGSREKEKKQSVRRSACDDLHFVSLVLMAVILLLNRRLLGLLFGEVEGDVMEACVTYLRISAYSYPAIAIYNAGAAIYRSMGKDQCYHVPLSGCQRDQCGGKCYRGIFPPCRSSGSGLSFPDIQKFFRSCDHHPVFQKEQ